MLNFTENMSLVQTCAARALSNANSENFLEAFENLKDILSHARQGLNQLHDLYVIKQQGKDPSNSLEGGPQL